MIPFNIFVLTESITDSEQLMTTFSNEKVFNVRGRFSQDSARTYIDQLIAINFLTSILYLLAFYSAHREMYTLTLAFTSTLAFTMSK